MASRPWLPPGLSGRNISPTSTLPKPSRAQSEKTIRKTQCCLRGKESNFMADPLHSSNVELCKLRRRFIYSAEDRKLTSSRFIPVSAPATVCRHNECVLSRLFLSQTEFQQSGFARLAFGYPDDFNGRCSIFADSILYDHCVCRTLYFFKRIAHDLKRPRFTPVS